MTRKTVVAGSAAAFTALVVYTFSQSCVRANLDQARVRPGMSVADVIHAVRGWDLCLANAESPSSSELVGFTAMRGGGRFYLRIYGEHENMPLDTEVNFIESVEKQMADGRAWNIQFTYYGEPRSTFRVDFDSKGEVKSVSDNVAGP
jgi:hypothetical protein